MSTTSDAAKSRRAATKSKGRKNTKAPKVITPRVETNAWWKSSDLSLDSLDLRTIDKKASKKSAKKATKSLKSTSKKKLTAAQKKKAERARKKEEGRRKAEPVKVPQKLNIAKSVTSATVELTTEGASTLTVTLIDPDRAVVESGIFDRDEDGALEAVDVKLDTQWFRLVKVAKSGNSFTLTFEDRPVAYLRSHSKYKWVSRSDKTRAQFIHSMVTEVKAVRIKFFCPEEVIAQKIAGTSTKTGTVVTKTETTTRRTSSSPSSLQGKQGPINMANARRVMARAEKHKAGPKATLALVMACLVEPPDFGNPRTPSADGYNSYGILQARVGPTWNTLAHALDIEWCVDRFLKGPAFTGGSDGAINLAKKNPSWTAGQIAQKIEGSGYPKRYDEQHDAAEKIVSALGGSSSGGGESSGTSTSSTTTRRKQYRFARGEKGKREDSWTAIQRLAKEVNWRAFMRAGELWYVTDDWLLSQLPAVVIGEDTRWVDNIDYDWDNGKTVQSVTVTCRAERWAFLPGTTVAIDDPGPALGRWIVTKVSRSLSSSTTTITLSKKSAKKKEPAPETASSTDSKNSTSKAEGGDSVVDKVYAEALRISNEGKPYGPAGHTGSWASARAARNQDCSSSTSLALHAAGLMKTSAPQVSDYFRNWGKPGKGEEFTVWVRPGGGNNGHVFIEFYGRKYKRFDTSPQGSGGEGARMRTGGRTSYSGMSPRHV